MLILSALPAAISGDESAGGGSSSAQLAASVNPEDGSLMADVSFKGRSAGDGAGGGFVDGFVDVEAAGGPGLVEAAAHVEVGDLMQGWLSSSVRCCMDSKDDTNEIFSSNDI